MFFSGRGEGEDFWLGAGGCAVPEQHGNWGEYCRVTGVGRRTIKCHSAVLVQSWHLHLQKSSKHGAVCGCHVLLHGSSDHRGFSAAAVKKTTKTTTNSETWVTYRSGNIAAHKTKKHMPEPPQREECVCHIFLFRFDQTEENDKMRFDFGVRAENCFWQGESSSCCHFTHM